MKTIQDICTDLAYCYQLHLHFSGRFLGEPGLAGSTSVLWHQLFRNRISGKVHRSYEQLAEVLSLKCVQQLYTVNCTHT